MLVLTVVEAQINKKTSMQPDSNSAKKTKHASTRANERQPRARAPSQESVLVSCGWDGDLVAWRAAAGGGALAGGGAGPQGCDGWSS